MIKLQKWILCILFFSITGPANVVHAVQIQPGIYNQKLNHFGVSEPETFNQRFWFVTEYAKGDNPPILFRICGEAACDLHFLHDMTLEYAKQLGANIVYLEHRYYGKSQPFTDLSTEHLQFLTLENAIEDLASFQKWITQERHWNGKWISLGGSYSGTLSAIYRLVHPELVVGALASSAPMLAKQNDDSIEQSQLKLLSSTKISDHSDMGWRQWAYQACTSVGFWEAIGYTLKEPNPWMCLKLFEIKTPINKDLYNQKYYIPFISNSPEATSNILFTYGTEDIWTEIGILSNANKNSGITIKMIEGAGHHFDLNFPDTFSDSQEVLETRKIFIELTKVWLK